MSRSVDTDYIWIISISTTMHHKDTWGVFKPDGLQTFLLNGFVCEQKLQFQDAVSFANLASIKYIILINC